MQILRWSLMIIGTLGVLDTLFLSMRNHLNLGVLLPLLIGVPMVLLGLFLPRLTGFFSAGFGLVCKWVLLIGALALFLAFFITWIVIDSAAEEDPPHADVLIVLGAGIRNGHPSLVLSKRLDRAADYLETHPETIVIVSGGVGNTESISEAQAMQQYLTNKGIDAQRIWMEGHSSSTEENFAFSHAMIRERIGENVSIAFVTTDFHVYRAGLVAKKQGMQATGIAAPDVWYLSFNNHLRECIALWAYALLGRV